MRPNRATTIGRLLLPFLLGVLGLAPRDAQAVLSESGGTGVWEVQSAESQREATLQLGVFGSLQRLKLGGPADGNLNALQGGANGAFGIPGGFELSATFPLYGFYTTAGDLGNPLDQNIAVRLGDLTGRLRWSGPMGLPGLRWGFEGGVRIPTGNDREEVYSGRGATQPYSATELAYTGRSMLTWDGLRAGSGIPLRLHANAGYTIQRDERRFLIPHAPLPLELGSPQSAKDNDYLSLGAAAEVDLARVTLFGEVVTDQLVNERSLLRGKENRIAVTPGARIWLPGGLTLAGGYTINLAEDDPGTAFDPGRAWPDHEWRVAVSLGTVYRGARARTTQRVAAAPVPVPGTPPETPALAGGTGAAAPDSAALAAQEREKRIIERRDVQEEPTRPVPEPSAMEEEAPPPARGGGQPGPAIGAPPGATAPRVSPRPTPRYVDTDRDGIPDDQDGCPLLAEDWDGFQDLDGCPDVDNDQDGIPDVRDQCPNDPETYNGYYDFDGCPDGVPQRWIGSPRSATGGSPAEEESAGVRTDTTSVSPGGERASRSGPRRSAGTGAAAAIPPRPGSAAATSGALESLESRVARLEREGRARASATPAGPDVVVTPQPGSTVIAPPAVAPQGAEAARLAALETEIRQLRSQDSERSASRDSTQQQLLHRLDSLQASLAVMTNRLPVEQEGPAGKADEAPEDEAPEEARPAAPSAEDTAAVLDALLPLGVAKTFPEIRFATGSASLDPGALETLAAIARALRAAPGARITLIGHTDDVGGETANLRLSRERARAVAAVLFASGVERAQISVEGRGESAPVAPNDTDAGRRANRRVEFVRNR